jgi:hypothetical protein
MAVLFSYGSIGLVIVVVFSRGLGRSHGRRTEKVEREERRRQVLA